MAKVHKSVGFGMSGMDFCTLHVVVSVQIYKLVSAIIKLCFKMACLLGND